MTKFGFTADERFKIVKNYTNKGVTYLAVDTTSCLMTVYPKGRPEYSGI